jgi:hypothetical protein
MRFYVGSTEFKVLVDDNLAAQRRCYGEFRPMDSAIVVDRGVFENKSKLTEVLIHELLEVIRNCCDLEDNLSHQTLSTIATTLSQALESVFRTWYKKEGVTWLPASCAASTQAEE